MKRPSGVVKLERPTPTKKRAKATEPEQAEAEPEQAEPENVAKPESKGCWEG